MKYNYIHLHLFQRRLQYFKHIQQALEHVRMVKLATSLIPNPENEKARKILEERSEEYSTLLIEYSRLTNVVKKNLETAYMLKIGRKEYELYSVTVRILQIKREITLYQEAINRGANISEEEVEEIIEQEFIEYMAKLEEQKTKIKEADDYFNAPTMSDEESKKLTQLYHKLVKQLHPDLHPDQPPEATKLLQLATEYYKNGDINGIELVADMVKEMLLDTKMDMHVISSLEMMKKQIASLEKKIESIKKKMERLSKEPPFSYRSWLFDNAVVMSKRQELDKQLKESTALLSQLQEFRNSLKEIK